MIGRNTLKRTVKRTAGWASMLEWLLAAPAARQTACIFYYHRIADVKFVDPRIDDWNVSPLLFERQVAALSEFAEIVPLLDLPHRLKLPSVNSKPLVCLTFDDGYAGFHSQALPILQRYRAPATAFVVTGSIGRSEPQQFDKWALKHQATSAPETWRAMTWKELEECAATGLVAIGAHSHRHLKGSCCTPSQMAEEAEESREMLRRRLGERQARAYAYPYGSTRLRDASPGYAQAVRAAGYEMAVTTDLGLVSPNSDPYLLPRIEAHAVDVPRVLQAKAGGALASYNLTDHFRLVNRAL